MAVLKVYFDNIICFDGFSANFTYPKKIVNNPLINESLKGFPNIRYKKVNIIIGSNATGKTSFGRALWHLFMFLSAKEANRITSIVKNKAKNSRIEMDHVEANGIFRRIEVLVNAIDQSVGVRIRQLQANPDDSYESLVKRLPEDKPFVNYVAALAQLDSLGWYFVMPSIEGGAFESVNCDIFEEDKFRFSDILKRF